MKRLNPVDKTEHTHRFFYLLLVFLVALVVADGTITRFLVTNRLGTEANPFLKYWVESDLLLILKLVGSAAAAFILWRVYLRNRTAAWITTVLFITVYAVLVVWNLIVFSISGSM